MSEIKDSRALDGEQRKFNQDVLHFLFADNLQHPGVRGVRYSRTQFFAKVLVETLQIVEFVS